MNSERSSSYSWILLGILFLTYLFASLDRLVLNLLVEPIKADFSLSDTEISLLQGPAFIITFVLAIIPMGMLVDRVRRTGLLAASLAFWSVMTGLCGLAGSFITLFIARAGLGIGGASLNPAGYSLISDSFKKERLGLALGLFITGGAVGAGLAFLLGGAMIGELNRHGDIILPLVGELRPWQVTFLMLAVPGILLAFVLNILPDPPRSRQPSSPASERGSSIIKSFYLDNKWLLARHHIAMGATNLALLGMMAWIAPLLSRVHGWDLTSIGVATGATLLVAHPLGTLLAGGIVGDYLTRFGAHMRLVVCAVTLALAAVCGLIYPLLDNPWGVIFLYGAANMFAAVTSGAGNAALQFVVPSEIRGRASAINHLIMLGSGMLGPVLVALASDILFPYQEGIRYATVLVMPAALLLASLLMVWAVKPYRRLAET